MRRISPNVPVNAGQAWHNVIKRPRYAHQGICSRAPEFALHHGGSKYLQEEPSPKTRSGGQHETMLGASAAQWCKGEGTAKDSSASKAQQQTQHSAAAQPAATRSSKASKTQQHNLQNIVIHATYKPPPGPSLVHAGPSQATFYHMIQI